MNSLYSMLQACSLTHTWQHVGLRIASTVNSTCGMLHVLFCKVHASYKAEDMLIPAPAVPFSLNVFAAIPSCCHICYYLTCHGLPILATCTGHRRGVIMNEVYINQEAEPYVLEEDETLDLAGLNLQPASIVINRLLLKCCC